MRFVFLVVVLLGFSVQFCQRRLDSERFDATKIEERYFLPNKSLFKMSVMGYDEAAADLLWIRSILIASDFFESCSPEEGRWLLSMLQTIVHLDPKEKTVYHYGGLMMELCEDIDASDAMYEAGFRAFPEEGRFAFMISANASNYRKDIDRALVWMKKAAAAPNSAPWYSASVAGLIKKDDGLESSIVYLEEQLKMMEPSPFRDYTEERYRSLVHESYEIKIEALRQRFIGATGSAPTTVEELHIPVADPYEKQGGVWIIAEDGIVRSSIVETKKRRKAQAGEKELLRMAK